MHFQIALTDLDLSEIGGEGIHQQLHENENGNNHPAVCSVYVGDVLKIRVTYFCLFEKKLTKIREGSFDSVQKCSVKCTAVIIMSMNVCKLKAKC